MRKELPAPRVNETFYLVLVAGGTILSAWLSAWGVLDSRVNEILYISWIFTVPSVLVGFALVYKSWQAIQDGQARMKPLESAVLLVVPIYHLYWVFQVWYGFAVDYNRYLQRQRLVIPQLPVPLYFAFSLALVLNMVLLFVPTVNFILFVLVAVLVVFVVRLNCRAINQLAYVGLTPPRQPGGLSAEFRELAQTKLLPLGIGIAGLLLIGVGGLWASVAQGKYTDQRDYLAALDREYDLKSTRPDDGSRRRVQEILDRYRPAAERALGGYEIHFYIGLAIIVAGLLGGGAATALLMLARK